VQASLGLHTKLAGVNELFSVFIPFSLLQYIEETRGIMAWVPRSIAKISFYFEA
jgi:hypothetical protein